MQEAGIDISAQRPKRISDVPLGDIDTVVTLCVEEVCVGLPAELRQEAWVLPDPTATSEGGAETKAMFRRVRDDIQTRIQEFMKGWS
jgi:arsenate reductase